MDESLAALLSAPLQKKEDTSLTTSAIIDGLSRQKQANEEKERAQIAMKEKMELLRAKRTMDRDSYAKLQKEYEKKKWQREANKSEGVEVPDPAANRGQFAEMIRTMKEGLADDPRMSQRESEGLIQALSGAEGLIRKMNKGKRQQLDLYAQNFGLTDFMKQLGLAEGSRGGENEAEATNKQETTTTTTIQQEQKKQESTKTAKNRRKRVKQRAKKREAAAKEKERLGECRPTSST